METKQVFVEEDMVVDEGLGYPKAYAKLCRNAAHYNPYGLGPPLSFIPRALPSEEAMRLKDLSQMFPVTDSEAKPSVDPSGFLNLLWKQLSHIGNAGFDPALFRVDPYGNVIYFHADPASPLSWAIDHWFPCSRGGKTVPSNLRIVQWQVYRKKHNKLEFLIPWWDLQLGISVNQFLSIFASKNSDFRTRAFSYLFLEGGNEELNELVVVDSHAFPQHFDESKRQIGLAPAAIVPSQKYHLSILHSLNVRRRTSFGEDDNESLSSSFQRFRPSVSKEKDNPNQSGNPYISISFARDSFKKQEEVKKIQAETSALDDELNSLKKNNDSERIALQDLESLLIKKRRRVEKCRRLSESQSSYRSMLEKMIRDAMHQSVVYKEQIRLNQAASNALMARLEAQRAFCDSSEKDLHRRIKQRDELEKQTMPCLEESRKRSRSRSRDSKDNIRLEIEDSMQSFPFTESSLRRTKKELREFLEEEQKASEAGISLDYEQDEEEKQNIENKMLTLNKTEMPVDFKLKKLKVEVGSCSKMVNRKKAFLVPSSPKIEDDEEYRTQRGRDNMEKWVQRLLENAKEGSSPSPSPPHSVQQFEDHANSLNDTKLPRVKQPLEEVHNKKKIEKKNIVAFDDNNSVKSVEWNEAEAKRGRQIARSDSAGNLRSFPPSPSLILGVKRSMDCMKKPLVMDDNNENIYIDGNTMSVHVSAARRSVK